MGETRMMDALGEGRAGVEVGVTQSSRRPPGFLAMLVLRGGWR